MIKEQDQNLQTLCYYRPVNVYIVKQNMRLKISEKSFLYNHILLEHQKSDNQEIFVKAQFQMDGQEYKEAHI